MSLMLAEINEQPGVIADVLERELANVERLADELRERGVRHVVIAARGTSDNAATYAKYLLEIVCGVPVSLAAPSVYTLYDARVRLDGCLMLGISQSGQSPDIVQTLASARASGAITACITNVADAPIVGASDHRLLCHAGVERAVAATKTYTASLALVALLACVWAGDNVLLDSLRQIPQQMRAVLTLDGHIAHAVERYRYMHECAVLTRGINQCTALEAALKMTETSYLLAKPYSGADFLHGPIAIIEEGFPCFVYAPDGRAYPMLLELVLKLRERQAEVVAIGRAPELLDMARCALPVPIDVDERLSPLLYIVPGQLWACHLARARGNNPDAPRGLSKVTLTR